MPKLKALALAASLLSVVAPIRMVAFGTGFLICADLATGVWASVRESQRITSDRFGRSVRKSLVYLTALVVAQVAEAYVLQGTVPVVKVVAGLVGTTELMSIGENLTRISGVNFRKAFIERLMPSQADKRDRDSSDDLGGPPKP